ncbi:MAG: hypothetical protein M3137_16795 [Actinomycetota bacterium]|nr:hypothetical protein [Actinomycetota bacterium]
MNITNHIALPAVRTGSRRIAASRVMPATTWVHPKPRCSFDVTTKATNQRPLSPPEWLSP